MRNNEIDMRELEKQKVEEIGVKTRDKRSKNEEIVKLI